VISKALFNVCYSTVVSSTAIESLDITAVVSSSASVAVTSAGAMVVSAVLSGSSLFSPQEVIKITLTVMQRANNFLMYWEIIIQQL
jgi:cyanophycinase-like exopeptidase